MFNQHVLCFGCGSCGLLIAGCAQAGGEKVAEAKIHCGGVNACKGQTDCKSAENSCKGQNSCKGHGFKALSRLTVTPWADTKYHNVKMPEAIWLPAVFLERISRAIDIKVSLSWFRAGLAQTALTTFWSKNQTSTGLRSLPKITCWMAENHFIIWIVSGKLSGRDARRVTFYRQYRAA